MATATRSKRRGGWWRSDRGAPASAGSERNRSERTQPCWGDEDSSANQPCSLVRLIPANPS
jgi:hypothetical protein